VTGRRTRAQRAVLSALGADSGFVSAQDLHGRLRQAGDPVGLTSVYRALQALADEGAVDTIRTTAGETGYRSCASDGHHHHLVCRGCGRAVEVAAPELERWVGEVGRQHGFAVESHLLEVTGVCPDCQGVVSSAHDD
jgi:Fur family transcriptional regulator, ferric uptake regulator